MLERGWFPEARVNLSYTDRGGLTVNNGERIVVSNLDVGTFVIGSYSVYGMEGSGDPPATADGLLTVEFMSGNPSAERLRPVSLCGYRGGGGSGGVSVPLEAALLE